MLMVILFMPVLCNHIVESLLNYLFCLVKKKRHYLTGLVALTTFIFLLWLSFVCLYHLHFRYINWFSYSPHTDQLCMTM